MAWPTVGKPDMASLAATVAELAVAISTPPTPAGGQDDRDGRWLLCDACHDLWARRTLGAWVRRAWTVQVDRSPWGWPVPPPPSEPSSRPRSGSSSNDSTPDTR